MNRFPATRRALVLFLFLLTGLAAAAAAGEDAAVPRRTFGYVPPPDYAQQFREHLKVYPADKLDLPSSFNWAAQGGVTVPKDQGQCGACWSFAAVGQIEAHMKIHYGIALDLSEQQGVDCNPYGAGCDGGWASAVYNVAMSHGMVLEEAMPYAAVEHGYCVQDDYPGFAFVDGWNYVSNDVEQIKTAIYTGGPVCSALNADDPFPAYTGGCYDVNNGGYTNHLVLIVGWDDRACDGAGGWICKNSWGTDFGEGGYFTIQYGTALIGTSVTQIQVHVPPTSISVTGPITLATLPADTTVTITWTTTGDPVSTVDIRASFHHHGFTTIVAQGIPNTGSYQWTIPNESTDELEICVIAAGDTRQGFGFSPLPLRVLGHRKRYVSAAGSNTPPYESPATAAHSLADCVAACTGIDTVLVAGGDYLETVQIDGPVTISGGWDDAFTLQDRGLHPTRWTSMNTALRFSASAGDRCGVSGVEFTGCQGSVYDQPAAGRHGGAIRVLGASPRITDCVFSGDRADQTGGFGTGGAIQVIGGAPRIEGCTFTDCAAVWGGAVALFDAGGAVLAGNSYLRCVSQDTVSDGRGGAIYAEGGSVILQGEDIREAVARSGGGLHARGVDAVLTDVTARDCRAAADGGAVLLTGGTVDLARGEFRGNSAGAGGGAVYADSVRGRLAQAVVRDNAAGILGGGVRLLSTRALRVEHCLLTGNSAAYGGGLMVLQDDSLLVRGNLVMLNTGGGGVAGSLDPQRLVANDVWNNAGGDYVGTSAGPTDLAADPLCKDSAAGLYGLTTGSPCIDACPDDPLDTDPDGSAADIGPLGGAGAVPVAPGPVTGLAVTDPGDGTRVLSWNPVGDPDLAAYAVFRAGPGGRPGALAATVAAPATSWIDTAPDGAAYFVAAVDTAGYQGSYGEPAGGTTAAGDTPAALAITGVVPNPFNPRTTLRFTLPAAGPVDLAVYDVQGRRVRRLVAGRLAAGRHAVSWDGRDDAGRAVPSGIYLARLRAGNARRSAKLLLAR